MFIVHITSLQSKQVYKKYKSTKQVYKNKNLYEIQVYKKSSPQVVKFTISLEEIQVYVRTRK